MRYASFLVLATCACGGAAPPPNSAATAPAEEPPVALNAEPAVQYPPDLYDRRVEGDVVLRLFADSTGRLAPESTRVAESSGSAALDSAAVQGVARLRYAPARRHGLPVATGFLQTVQFRHPGGSAPATNRPPAHRPSPDSSVTRRDASRAAPDSLKAARPASDSGARDSTRARPDSNDAAR